MLDYTIERDSDDFQVWTPDKCGACIGSGTTEQEAKDDAIKSMLWLVDRLRGGDSCAKEAQAS